MKTVSRLFVMVAIALVAGCGGKAVVDVPIDVESYVEDGVDFNNFSTWMWMPTINVDAIDYELKDPETKRMIAQAVEGELFERGVRRSDVGSADLVMNAHVMVKEIDPEIVEEIYGGNYYPEYRAELDAGRKKKTKWTEGTLVLLAFDSKSGQMVWRASMKADVTKQSKPNERQQRIDRAVEKMFYAFPRRTS
jgi:hypothetical protein